MTDQTNIDRPSALVRKPKPAPDARVDPVDYQPSPPPRPAEPAPRPAAEPAATSFDQEKTRPRLGRPKARREPDVAFSTRIAVSISQLLDAAAEKEGITIRSAIEHAIRHTYGQGQS